MSNLEVLHTLHNYNKAGQANNFSTFKSIF